MLTPRDDRLLARASENNPKATARDLQHEVGGAVDAVSLSTVKRSLRLNGIAALRPLKAPILTKKQMKVRLRWAKAHESWTVDQWKQVGVSLYYSIHISNSFNIILYLWRISVLCPF
jgi:hypothetical protein